MCSGKASIGKGMERTGLGKPTLRQGKDARPGGRASLTAAAQTAPPERHHPVTKNTQAGEVSRHRVVVEVALNDRLEPFASLGHRILQPHAKLPPDLSQLASHTLADGSAPHREPPQSILP